MYTYLLLNVFTIFFPLAFSFDRKVNYFGSWRFIFPGLLITGTFFLIWDEIFTQIGVWSFNPKFITGLSVARLPVEEILFFVTVPFACVFIYCSLNARTKIDYFRPYHRKITEWLFYFSFAMIFVSLSGHFRAYTFVTFTLLTALLGYHRYFTDANYMGRFYRAYFVSMIPFFIVNGILTSLPVVLYNDRQNLDIRMYTVPFEDMFYSLVLLLMNVDLFEYFKAKAARASLHRERTQ